MTHIWDITFMQSIPLFTFLMVNLVDNNITSLQKLRGICSVSENCVNWRHLFLVDVWWFDSTWIRIGTPNRIERNSIFQVPSISCGVWMGNQNIDWDVSHALSEKEFPPEIRVCAGKSINNNNNVSVLSSQILYHNVQERCLRLAQLSISAVWKSTSKMLSRTVKKIGSNSRVIASLILIRLFEVWCVVWFIPKNVDKGDVDWKYHC